MSVVKMFLKTVNLLSIIHVTITAQKKDVSIIDYFRKNKSVSQQESVEYAIIVDAGVTLKISSFSFSWESNGSLVPIDQLTKSSNTTLSSLADDPEQGVQTINDLIDKVKVFVPTKSWSRTLLSMKVSKTNYEKLHKQKANIFLKNVRTMFDELKFKTTSNSVGIMDGSDECFFSWFTVNFLYNQKLNVNSEDTKTVIDLGSDFIQIGFFSDNEEILDDHDAFYDQKGVIQREILSMKSNVYCKRYSGFGLMNGRVHNLMRLSIDEKNESYMSWCVPSKLGEIAFNFGPKTYKMRGTKLILDEKPQYRERMYETCKKLYKYVVDMAKIEKPTDLIKSDIKLISYFFNLAENSNIIDNDGNVTVQTFFKEAKEEYVKNNNNKTAPFKVQDLTFSGQLLSEGFGIPLDFPVAVLDKIDDRELNWALGAAYYFIQLGDSLLSREIEDAKTNTKKPSQQAEPNVVTAVN